MSALILTPDDIRGLTLWRPWGWAFTHADKRVENRPRMPPRAVIGRYLALHSGKHWDADACTGMLCGQFGDAARACPSQSAQHPESAITCVAHVTEAFEWTHPDAVQRTFSEFDMPPEDDEIDPWSFGPVVILTPTIITLDEPVPCPGAQGYWRLKPDVFARVRDQVAAITARAA